MGARHANGISLSPAQLRRPLVVDETHTPHLHKALLKKSLTRSGWPESCFSRTAAQVRKLTRNSG